jgi:serine protease Do
MRIVGLLTGIAIAAIGLPAGTAHAGFYWPDSKDAGSLPDIIQPILGAVVNISVVKAPGPASVEASADIAPGRTLGSGFVISPDGYIVTNKHVVDGAYNITVAFDNGTTSIAEIVATNQRPDLALLKIKTDKPLQYVKFGDSDALRVGEPVIAIGNALGLSSSVSAGIVSALNRDVNQTWIDDFIQTDAAINRGNSGGPLFNTKGEVIGVNWAVYAGQQGAYTGLGFAIPSNDASWVVAQMRQYGSLRAGFIGARLQQVSPDIQMTLKLPSRSGGIVTSIIEGAPAASAGLQTGDVILSLNGHEPRDVRALLRDLAASATGSKISLRVWHRGQVKTISLTVANWPENSSYDPAGSKIAMHNEPRKIPPDLGLNLAMADPRDPQVPDTKGLPAVSIASVAAGSPAADLQLSPGSLILKVGFDEVGTPRQVRAKLDEARSKGEHSVAMLIMTGEQIRWVTLPLTAE